MRALNMKQTLSNGLTRSTIIRINILVLLSMADYLLTCYAIQSGVGIEGNPLLSWTTLEGIGIAKMIGLLTLIYWFQNRPRILYLVMVILAAIVCWNLWVILSGGI